MYHVEVRQRSRVARAFNLSGAELSRRLLEPLASGGVFRFAEREWEAARVSVRILEGPELVPGELMLGRGWTNAERSGADVSERLLAARPRVGRGTGVPRLKQRILARIEGAPLPLVAIVDLADDLLGGHRASERLAAAELAAWELLHEGGAVLVDGAGARLARDEWEACLLRWSSWSTQATASAISLSRSESGANR